LHLSLALLPVDRAQADYLSDRLLAGDPAEVLAIRTLLTTQAEAVTSRLWSILEDPEANPSRRLRAACFLAAHAADDHRWAEVAPDLMTILAAENAFHLKDWAATLHPVASALLPALAEVVIARRAGSEQRLMAELYAEFATDSKVGFAPLEAVLSETTEDTPTAQTALARRQASAAAALAAVDRWERVWPLLRHTDDPTLRSYLIERLGKGCADAADVIEHLNPDFEPDPSVRRAVLFILGELPEDRLPSNQRQRLAAKVVALDQEEPDPGTRAAADWLLRQWGHFPAVKASDEEPMNPAMVLVSPGEITVTDQDGQARMIRVEKPFRLAVHEVTIAEFRRFRPEHAWDKRSGVAEDCPVNEVSWYDAAAYCNWLSRETGLSSDQCCYEPNDQGQYSAGMKIKPRALNLPGFRLPTAAEWEFACRSGAKSVWSFGNGVDLLDRYGWTMSNSGIRSHPVRTLRPNELGLFDSHGNVWEWCQDRVDFRGIEMPLEAGESEVVRDDAFRPLRGGTFLNDPVNVGSAAAIWNPPGNHTGADGFRVARTVP
jgi:formylglycine-generating enzyme required for sulfatase activity